MNFVLLVLILLQLLPLERMESRVVPQKSPMYPLLEWRCPGCLQGAPRMSANEKALYDAADRGNDAKVRQLLATGPTLSLLP